MLTASELHERLPEIDLVTIYRNLDLFAKEGMIKKLQFDDEARYEFQQRPHHHAICSDCNRTIHFTVSEDKLAKLLPIKEFSVEGIDITVTGRCQHAKKSKTLFITILAGLLVAALGYFNIDIERSEIEEVLYENLPTYTVAEEELELRQSGVVSRVIDGDTIDVSIDGEVVTVRLIGIDAPETEFSPTGAECYGSESSSYLKIICWEK